MHQVFHDAVDEYIEWCKKYGKDIEKLSIEY